MSFPILFYRQQQFLLSSEQPEVFDLLSTLLIVSFYFPDNTIRHTASGKYHNIQSPQGCKYACLDYVHLKIALNTCFSNCHFCRGSHSAYFVRAQPGYYCTYRFQVDCPGSTFNYTWDGHYLDIPCFW